MTTTTTPTSDTARPSSGDGPGLAGKLLRLLGIPLLVTMLLLVLAGEAPNARFVGFLATVFFFTLVVVGVLMLAAGQRAGVLARRELGSYFYSPIAYVALALFLMASGFLFQDDFEPGRPAALRTLLDWMVWLLVFIVPVLCMGLLAQEWSTGTIETLMTAPVRETDVVLGKFLGALGFFAVLIAPTVLYVLLLRLYARPDVGQIVSGYIGILLVGALFIAVGLFCSSLTRSQVVAAVSSIAVLFIITIAPWWASRSASTLGAFWRRLIDQGVYNRYTDFSRGVLDTGNVVFFVAFTAVFLFFTTKVLESRRWK